MDQNILRIIVLLLGPIIGYFFVKEWYMFSSESDRYIGALVGFLVSGMIVYLWYTKFKEGISELDKVRGRRQWKERQKQPHVSWSKKPKNYKPHVVNHNQNKKPAP